MDLQTKSPTRVSKCSGGYYDSNPFPVQRTNKNTSVRRSEFPADILIWKQFKEDKPDGSSGTIIWHFEYFFQKPMRVDWISTEPFEEDPSISTIDRSRPPKILFLKFPFPGLKRPDGSKNKDQSTPLSPFRNAAILWCRRSFQDFAPKTPLRGRLLPIYFRSPHRRIL